MSAQSAGDAWARTRDGFIEDYLKAQPFFAAQDAGSQCRRDSA
jgi:hypothetical protein